MKHWQKMLLLLILDPFLKKRGEMIFMSLQLAKKLKQKKSNLVGAMNPSI